MTGAPSCQEAGVGADAKPDGVAPAGAEGFEASLWAGADAAPSAIGVVGVAPPCAGATAGAFWAGAGLASRGLPFGLLVEVSAGACGDAGGGCG